MKIKNAISCASLLLLVFLSSGFVNSNQTSIELPEKIDASFIEFLSLFDKAEMPFEIGLNDLEQYEDKKVRKKKVIRKKRSATGGNRQLIRQYIQESLFMSRMGPPEIMPIARFYPNEKTIAVIYMPYRAFGGASELTFKLALFDLKGNSINCHEEEMIGNKALDLATTSPYSHTQTFSIDSNGLIIQKTYKTIWEKDVRKSGVQNNTITDYVLEKTAGFQIEKTGIVVIDNSTFSNDRASLD